MKTQEWINTDRAAVVNDISSLGLDEAVDRQMELIDEAVSRGDSRWTGITADDLLAAMEGLV